VETEHQLALQLRDLLYPPLGHHYQPRRMHAGTDVEAPPPYELADPAGTMSLTGLARGERPAAPADLRSAGRADPASHR
jgi:hypothetical protein